MRIFDLSSWLAVVTLTVFGTAFCAGIALYVDSFNFASLSPEQVQRALLMNTVLPIALAGPLLFLTLSKMRQLTLATRELQKVAATDSLTAVMNRGAFTMLVEAYLERATEQATLRTGALLVVDADHFKAINDSFGHQNGDRALRLIATAITGAVRSGDLVGRIGGEEFGVFLPGADLPQTGKIAERIRSAVGAVEFYPDGGRRKLTVSVGGAFFSDRTTYERLYEKADSELYGAKRAGRDRISLTSLSDVFGTKRSIGRTAAL